MNIHAIMHVPFEGIGCINNWVIENNHKISYTRVFEQAVFPQMDEFDFLVIMGGPMSVYEEDIYPWLKLEKQFIRKSIDNGKSVIGVCLGSQFLAEVLEAKVYPNKIKEIGWLDISKVENHEIIHDLPEKIKVFQWHGDTFDLPEKAVHLFKSEVCINQSFIYDNRVLALQFHFEGTPKSINDMVINGLDELVNPSTTIHTPAEIENNMSLTVENNKRMFKLLDYLAKKVSDKKP